MAARATSADVATDGIFTRGDPTIPWELRDKVKKEEDFEDFEKVV
jgi:hypothetical protein